MIQLVPIVFYTCRNCNNQFIDREDYLWFKDYVMGLTENYRLEAKNKESICQKCYRKLKKEGISNVKQNIQSALID